jgi:phage/plasmid-like protein (TIGR03299 family)
VSHQIYDEKFLSYRQPAWHNLGQVITEEIGAVEAGRRIVVPTITTEPVITASGLATDYKAILGDLKEGKHVYSVVTKNYHEITHAQFLETWDKCVKQHVETIGLLQTGAGLFLSAKLPSFDVKGDEIAAYILAENWLTGARSNKVRKTPVRVVCWNTLNLSDSQSLIEYIVHHTRPAIEQLEGHLKELLERSTSEYRALKEVYEILASAKVNDDQAKGLFTSVYPTKELPKALAEKAATDTDALDQLAAWERSNGSQLVNRNKCFALYSGDGVGSTTEAAKGTTWGVYNAVAEYEQYLKKYRKAESVAFGAGKDRVVDAFEAACELAGIETEKEEAIA